MKLKMNHIDKWKNSNGKIFPLVNEKTWYNFSVLHYYIALGNGVIEIVYFFFFFLIEFVPVRKRCFRPVFRKTDWMKWMKRAIRSFDIRYIYFFHTSVHHTPLQIYASQLLPNNSPFPRSISEFSRFKVNFAQQKWEIGFHCCKSVSPSFSFKRYCSNSPSPSRCDY